jgi:hypothetical protein
VAEQIKRLREALRDDDPAGVDAHAAYAGEVGTQRDAQLGSPPVVGVVERRVGRRAQRALHRPRPGSARKEAHVGADGVEIEPPARRRGLAESRSGGDHRGDDGSRALAHVEVALGGELLIGVGHDAPRDAEVRRQPARRRQSGSGGQPAVLDRDPKRFAQRMAHPPAAKLDLEQELVHPSWFWPHRWSSIWPL